MNKKYVIEVDGELKGKNIAMIYYPILTDKSDLKFIKSAYPKAKKVKVYEVILKELEEGVVK